MYTLIYRFLKVYLFYNSELQNISLTIGGQSLNMVDWLSHTFAIVSMVLIFAFLVIFIKWLFKLVAGMFTGIGR